MPQQKTTPQTASQQDEQDTHDELEAARKLYNTVKKDAAAQNNITNNEFNEIKPLIDAYETLNEKITKNRGEHKAEANNDAAQAVAILGKYAASMTSDQQGIIENLFAHLPKPKTPPQRQ